MMGRKILFALFISAASCSTLIEHEVEVSQTLQAEVEDFIEMLSKDTFQLERVVTISLKLRNVGHQVTIRNRIPQSCENLVGLTKRPDGFLVYYVSHGDPNPLIKVKGRYQCDIKPPLENRPFPIDRRERFYTLEGDSLKLLKMKGTE